MKVVFVTDSVTSPAGLFLEPSEMSPGTLRLPRKLKIIREGHFRRYENHFRSYKDHFKPYEDRSMTYEDHFKAYNDHFKAYKDHYIMIGIPVRNEGIELIVGEARVCGQGGRASGI